MNIFEYFEKSGEVVKIIGERTFFLRPNGTVVCRPHDGSYWWTISPSWYREGVWIRDYFLWTNQPPIVVTNPPKRIWLNRV